MQQRERVVQVVARVFVVLILLCVLGFVSRQVDQVVGRTAEFPLLGTYWARFLPEFLLLALAGFVLALPDDCSQRRVSWLKVLVWGVPALFIAFLPFLYYRPLIGKLIGRLGLWLLLPGGYGDVASFWLGVALALSFEKPAED